LGPDDPNVAKTKNNLVIKYTLRFAFVLVFLQTADFSCFFLETHHRLLPF
jgi:hypothetical protein